MPDSRDTSRASYWDERFAGEDYRFGTEPNQFLVSCRELIGGSGRVLCVADGEGRNSVFLARLGHRIDAFDLSPVGVEKARRFAARQGASVDYAVGDVQALAWPEALYDGVVVIFIQFADPPMRARIFANLQRCLKPGGVLLLLGYTPKQVTYRTGGPAQDDHMYTETLLREAFEAMQIIELVEYEDVLAEGSSHVGRSALIGLVARKR